MGLQDRNYMYRQTDDGNGLGGMGMMWGLIAVNAFFYLLAPPNSVLYNKLALYCVGRDFRFHQLLTAGFLHHDFMHILFNMYGLYIFGKLVARHLNGWKFLVLYLTGVLCGNALFLVLNMNVHVKLVGASGAVCAVMMAAAMLEPDQRFMLIFLPFAPVKTSTLIVCYTILEVIMMLTAAHSSIAHLAHLGGFISGYLCIKLMRRNDVVWDPLRFKRAIRWRRQDQARPDFRTGFDFRSPSVSRDELDALLDKISRYGINSLSPEELARLKQAREEMRR